jgi:hypothetical protein
MIDMHIIWPFGTFKKTRTTLCSISIYKHSEVLLNIYQWILFHLNALYSRIVAIILPEKTNTGFPNCAKACNALYNVLLEMSVLIENLSSFVTNSLP